MNEIYSGVRWGGFGFWGGRGVVVVEGGIWMWGGESGVGGIGAEDGWDKGMDGSRVDGLKVLGVVCGGREEGEGR